MLILILNQTRSPKGPGARGGQEPKGPGAQRGQQPKEPHLSLHSFRIVGSLARVWLGLANWSSQWVEPITPPRATLLSSARIVCKKNVAVCKSFKQKYKSNAVIHQVIPVAPLPFYI